MMDLDVSRLVNSPATTAIGGAAESSRAAVFTESPTSRPSPDPGGTFRRTSAGPVFTAART